LKLSNVSAYRVFVTYCWTNNVSVMGLPGRLPTFCRTLQTESYTYVHVIVTQANPTQRREEDRTGNRRGFTRFSFGELKKKRSL